jgi:amidophosphoribosyltransferase
MSQIGKFIAFEAAVALLRETGRDELLDEVYRRCAEEIAKPPGAVLSNQVRGVYEPFTAEEISAKIVDLVSPRNLEWKGEIEIIFQTIGNLHAAVPHHPGDWYFTGKYPTPGGYRVVNQAFVNYYEKNEGRSY